MEPKAHTIGYARVSTAGQNLDSQIDALKAAGCQKIYADKTSGMKESRPEWDRLVECLRDGDTLVVTELSRMSRSLVHMLQVVRELNERGINLISLRENIDTTTATGRAFVGLIGVVNQLELELRAERAAAGRASAKARGRSGGRPRTDADKLEQARILYENSDKTSQEVCNIFKIGKRTFFNYLAKCRTARQKSLDAVDDAIIGLDDDLRQMLIVTFGTMENARSWMGSPCFAFGGRRPIDVLSDADGTDAVKTDLVRMQHGIPV